MPAASGARCVPCRVEFYAGGRAEETPRRVIWRKHAAAVEKVLGRRRVMDKASGKTTEEFTLVLDGRIVKIRRTISGRWSLLLPPRPGRATMASIDTTGRPSTSS